MENAKIVNISGNVTIEGGKNNILAYGKGSDAAVLVNGGTLNIFGGYFKSFKNNAGKANPVIYLYGDAKAKAVCNIYGGVFEAEDATYMLNIQDDSRELCTFNVMGGIFVGFDPSHVNEDEITSFVIAGYKSVKTTYNGKEAYKVVKK